MLSSQECSLALAAPSSSLSRQISTSFTFDVACAACAGPKSKRPDEKPRLDPPRPVMYPPPSPWCSAPPIFESRPNPSVSSPLPGMFTGLEEERKPELTSPCEIELPLQFRDLLSVSLNPLDLRDLLPSYKSLMLMSSRAPP